MGVKYDSSIMNDAFTIYLANIVGLPCKSHTADCILFETCEHDFCMAFVLAMSASRLRCQLMKHI